MSIEINGKKLHKVEMKLKPFSEGTVSYLRYPEHRIDLKIVEDNGLLEIPSLLVVELLRAQILPTDPSELVSISVDGKSMGNFQILEFIYPDSGMKEEILIHMKRTK